MVTDDENAFAEEVRRLALDALPFGWSPALKDEIAQEICAEFVAHRSGYDPTRELSAYVGGAARKKVRAHVRGRRRREAMTEAYRMRRVAEPAPAWGDPHQSLELRELLAIGERLIAAMPPVRRAIWIAANWDEQPLAEVAESRGIALSTVKTHLQRASDAMRAAARTYLKGGQ